MHLYDGALFSDNRMVCFRRKAFLKSDTAAGLTRSEALFWCITFIFLWILNIDITVVWIWHSVISLDAVKSIPWKGLACEGIANRITRCFFNLSLVGLGYHFLWRTCKKHIFIECTLCTLLHNHITYIVFRSTGPEVFKTFAVCLHSVFLLPGPAVST